MSSFHVVTPNTEGIGLAVFTAVQVVGTRPRIQKQAAVVCCSSSFARHFSITLKMPPVGLHGHCHTLRSMVSSASVSSAVRRSARLTRSAAQLAADFHLLQLSQFLLGHADLSLTTWTAVDGNHTYSLRAVGLKRSKTFASPPSWLGTSAMHWSLPRVYQPGCVPQDPEQIVKKRAYLGTSLWEPNDIL